MVIRLFFSVLSLLLLSGGTIANAGSAEGTLHVSAQAVSGLSFKVISEPQYYRVRCGADRRDKRDDKDEERTHHSERNDCRAKEIKQARYAVTSNHHQGFALLVQAATSDVYSSVQIEIEGYGQLDLKAGQSRQLTIRGHQNSATKFHMKMRLRISDHAREGKYVWPVSVSAIPL